MEKIIDFRVRPRIPEALKSHKPGAISRTFKKNVEQYKAHDRFSPQPIEELISEMKGAGVTTAVIAAADNESVGGAKTPNEAIAKIAHKYPNEFVAFAGVDPHKGMEAVRELEYAVKELGMKGLNTEPFISRLHANHKKFYPLYAKAVELRIPVYPHTSINFDPGIIMDFGHPKYLDEVAVDFPELVLIARHGGWPWVLETIALAWRHPNIYIDISAISPKYLHKDYFPYFDGILKDKVVFGTSYPLLPFKRTVEEFKQLPLKEETKKKILYTNAAKILGLDADNQ